MSEREVLPCPFCGRQPDIEDGDTLYPTGWYREVDGMYVGVMPDERRPGDRARYGMHCKESSGGCGAEITGLTKDDAIDRWNRRAALSAPPADVLALLDDLSVLIGALPHSDEKREALRRIDAVLIAAARAGGMHG